jgi:sialidase-1
MPLLCLALMVACAFFTSAAGVVAAQHPALPESQATPWVDVFTRGEAGYFCIKIPSLTVMPSGALFATGEGRLDSCSDFTTTHLVYKRSLDGGKTWSALTTLYAEANGTVIGNAAPVVLRDSGRVLVVFCRNNLDVLITHSDDDGVTWTPPTVVSGVTNTSWTWVGTGPPAGLQLSTGRIVVPAYHSFTPDDDGEVSYGHTMLSDDGGETWYLGDTFTDGLNFPNEDQAVELSDGSVFINARGLLTARIGALSQDGGVTWSSVGTIPGLYQPLGGCEGSTIMLPDGQHLLYSGPMETSVLRSNLSLWSAPAGNASTGPGPWSPVTVVDTNSSAYSALAVLPPAHGEAVSSSVGLLFERSNQTLIIFLPDAITYTAYSLPALGFGTGNGA